MVYWCYVDTYTELFDLSQSFADDRPSDEGTLRVKINDALWIFCLTAVASKLWPLAQVFVVAR